MLITFQLKSQKVFFFKAVWKKCCLQPQNTFKARFYPTWTSNCLIQLTKLNHCTHLPSPFFIWTQEIEFETETIDKTHSKEKENFLSPDSSSFPFFLSAGNQEDFFGFHGARFEVHGGWRNTGGRETELLANVQNNCELIGGPIYFSV